MTSSLLWTSILFATVALGLTILPPRPPWCSKTNEQWYPCGACDSNCTKNATCTKDCRPGSCGCKSGYVRDDKGTCIALKDCPRKCGKYEKWYPCGACDSTCTKNTTCTKDCRPGSCGCETGYVRDDKGACIALKDCPPKCGKYEKWYPRGACDSPCHDDRKCGKECRKGSCGCLEGYKRTGDKKCITADKCPPKPKCAKNEKFYPCGPCDSTCKNPARKCPIECNFAGGCGCEENYVRDKKNKCVKKEKCKDKDEKEGKGGKGGDD